MSGFESERKQTYVYSIYCTYVNNMPHILIIWILRMNYSVRNPQQHTTYNPHIEENHNLFLYTL